MVTITRQPPGDFCYVIMRLMNLAQSQYTPFVESGMVLSALLRPFPVVRFMDWAETNNSTAKTIDDCERGQRYTSGKWSVEQRIPLSRCIEIANALDKRGWYCVPHQLNDDDTRRFVERVIEKSAHRPILEWSNEVWNSGFSQHQYAAERGAPLSPDKPHLHYQAQQTKLMRASAGDAADVVIAAQFWYEAVATDLLNLCGDAVDALAVAPYVGRTLNTLAPIDHYHIYQLTTADTDEAAALVAGYRSMCDKFGIKLWAYEGGWHGTAHHPDAAERERLTQLFCSYQRSQYAAADAWHLWSEWVRSGGDLFCPYALATRYGAEQWGVAEIISGDTIVVLPKYVATADSVSLL